MATTVLLVGTDAACCADWESLLSGQGYDVFAARSVEAALNLCPDLQPDLVLLNDFLPDSPGLDVCRRLKADPRNSLTPVVLVTGEANPTAGPRAREAGADDLWQHPSTSGEALNRVQTLLQLKNYVHERAESVIFSLAQGVEGRDPFDGGHGARVSANSVRFGQQLGLGAHDLETLRIGGLLHDIGKIGVPDSILSKPGALSAEEAKIVERHPVVGEQMCAPLKSLRAALPIIRSHHERMDGSGYPDGLTRERIPFVVRLVQIVDICDALTSDRSYRETVSLPCALLVLQEEAGRGWLDRELVAEFAAMVAAAVDVPATSMVGPS